jgi:hypothetical protein
MGTPAQAKGFEHGEMMVGWSVLSHNLWKLARLPQANANQEVEPDIPIAVWHRELPQEIRKDSRIKSPTEGSSTAYHRESKKLSKNR